MRKSRILVVEDNAETAKNIRMYVEHNGFSCQVTHSGLAAVAMMRQERFHLVVLDVMLPDLNGYQVCQHIRAFSDVPIIMLTAKVEDSDLEKGLEQGADDYIKKPYSNKELVARIKAHLRRQGSAEVHTIGPFHVDPDARQVSCSDRPLGLTKTEFQLILAMLKAPSRVFTRHQLFALCSDHESEHSDRKVDVHIHNLRKKITATGLEQHGIISVYGVGYKWVAP